MNKLKYLIPIVLVVVIAVLLWPQEQPLGRKWWKKTTTTQSTTTTTNSTTTTLPPTTTTNIGTNVTRFANLFTLDPMLYEKFDLFILNEWKSSNIPAIREKNPDAKIFLYMNSAYMRMSDTTNTVGGFQWVWDNHPEWFMRDNNGNFVYVDYYSNGDRWYYMDWGNEEWQAYWYTKTLEFLGGANWDGVFMDDVYATEYGSLSNSMYGSDSALQAAVKSFLDYQKLHLNIEGYETIGNVTSTQMWYPNLWEEWLHSSDGLMEEHFMHVGTNPNSGYTSLEDGDWWARRVKLVTDSEKLGKKSVFISFSGTDTESMQYAYACYLLGAGGNTYFYTAYNNTFSNVHWYSLWNLDLGEPKGPYYQRNGVYIREFTKGMVKVNPSRVNTNDGIPPNRAIITGG